MSINIKPLKNQAIVRQVKEYQTDGGIYLKANPEESKFKKGEVVAISEHLTSRTGIVPGDQILYSRVTEDNIYHNGEELTVIVEGDIGATVDKNMDWM